MSQALETIGHAKHAMQDGDFGSALTALEALDLSEFEPNLAIRVLVIMGTCLNALGHRTESISRYRSALAIIKESNLVMPEFITPDNVNTGLMVSIGAHDTSAVKKFLQMSLGELPPFAQEFKVSPLVRTRQWCKTNGVQVHEIDPSEIVEIGDGPKISRAFRYKTNMTWHATIPNAELVMGWDFVVAQTGEVLEGANYVPIDTVFPWMPHAYNAVAHLVAHVWPPQCTFVDEDALFLSAPERHHYGHWITDFLSRLRAWDRLEKPFRKIVISSQLPRKHRDTLELFGIEPRDLVECDLGHRYKFRSLRVVQAGSAAAPNPHNVNFLYESYRPRRPRDAHEGNKRIFYLVRDAGTRMPANHDELEQLFREFGITKVNPAKLSLTEQRTLFADADVIIGAFGTELYCLYNMHPGSTVIELIWDENHATVFGPNCVFLGINHHLIVCQAVENAATARRKIDCDLIVDCAELRRRLTMSIAPIANS